MKSTPCRFCTRISGCPLISRDEALAWDLVIHEVTNPGICEQWDPIGEKEGLARDFLHQHLGNGYLNGLYLSSRPVLTTKEENLMMIDVPDFAGMVREGMSVDDRTDQFLYETDDNGNFVLDQDSKRIPRGQLPVRKYAADPNGPIGEPSCNTIAYWDFDKVLDAVLRAERKLGWIGPKKNKKGGAAAQKEPEMPKIMIRNQMNKAVTKEPAKPAEEDKTPAKVKAKNDGGGKVTKVATNKPKVQPQEPEKESKSDALSTKQVEKLINEALKPIEHKLDKLLKKIGDGPGDRSLATTTTDGLTLLHDLLQQKISNLFFGLCELTGNMNDELAFPTLDESDGRDQAQNLLIGSAPTDLISYYLDGEGAAAEETEEGEAEEDEE